MVQAAGRPARLTSLSDTYQTMIGFAGTVEEDQLFVLTHRLKCLSKVVRQRENWMDLIKIRMKSEEESRRAARDLVEKSTLTEDSSDESATVGDMEGEE